MARTLPDVHHVPAGARQRNASAQPHHVGTLYLRIGLEPHFVRAQPDVGRLLQTVERVGVACRQMRERAQSQWAVTVDPARAGQFPHLLALLLRAVAAGAPLGALA